MNVYYELADCIVDPKLGKYFAVYNVRENQPIVGSRHLGLMQNSVRVWAEDEHSVRFIKHRYESLSNAKVDVKEFFWIKLKCQTV